MPARRLFPVHERPYGQADHERVSAASLSTTHYKVLWLLGTQIASPQVCAGTVAKKPKLPKLRTRVHRHGLVVTACSGRRTDSAAEVGGGAARHTRAWSVGAPAVVADCLRLRFTRGASKVLAVSRARQDWAVRGCPTAANDDQR